MLGGNEGKCDLKSTSAGCASAFLSRTHIGCIEGNSLMIAGQQSTLDSHALCGDSHEAVGDERRESLRGGAPMILVLCVELSMRFRNLQCRATVSRTLVATNCRGLQAFIVEHSQIGWACRLTPRQIDYRRRPGCRSPRHARQELSMQQPPLPFVPSWCEHRQTG